MDSEDENSDNEILKNSWKPKDKLIDSNVSDKIVAKGKNPEQGIEKGLPLSSPLPSDSAAGKGGLGSNTHVRMSMTTKQKAAELIKSIYLAEGISNEITNYEKEIEESIVKLKKQGDILSFSKNSITMENIKQLMVQEAAIKMSLKALSDVYEISANNRYQLILRRVIDLKLSDENENKLKINEGLENISKARTKFASDVDLINSKKESPEGQIKVFYTALNLQKNVIDKELNKLDSIILKELKQSDCCAFKNEVSKDLVKKLNDYNKANRNFNLEYNIVKRHLSDIIDRKKS